MINEQIDLPQEVVTDDDINVYTIESIKFIDVSEPIQYQLFIQKFKEYIDPKQIEINRLLAENKKLKEQLKPLRKTRRRLLPGEITEIKELIRKGNSNLKLASEYQVSDSTISKLRIQMRREGEEV